MKLKTYLLSIFLISVICAGVLSYTLGQSYIGSVSEVWVQSPFNEATYVFGKYNNTFYYARNSRTGQYEWLSINDDTVLQNSVDATNVDGGGSVYVKAGTYSLSVTVKDKVRLVIEKGATGITVSIGAGATCWVEDYNAGRTRFYSTGTLMWDENYASGKITTVYGNFTTAIYVTSIDEALSGSFVKVLKLIVENGTSFPASPATNQVFLRTDYKVLYAYDGAGWVAVGFRDYANLTGTPDLSVYLLADASRGLTADWDVGTYGIYGVTWLNATDLQFTSEFWYAGQNRTDLIANPAQTASYIVETDGSYTWMTNCSTGQRDAIGTNASQIINWARGNCTNGEKILVKAGTYTLDTPIIVGNYTWLEGESSSFDWDTFELAGTILALDDAVNDDVIKTDPSATVNAKGIRIRNLCIYGNRDNNPTGSDGVDLKVEGAIIENVIIDYVKEYGIKLDGFSGNSGWSNIVKNVNVWRSGGVYLGDYTSDNILSDIFINCRFSSGYSLDGFFLNSSGGNRFNNVHTINSPLSGYHLFNGSDNNIFVSCTSDSDDLYGWNIVGSSYNHIVSCVVYQTARHGMNIEGFGGSATYGNRIIGNRFSDGSANATNTYNDIHFNSSVASIQYTSISLNIHRGGTTDPKYCVALASNSFNNFIISNTYASGSYGTGAISYADENVVRDNIGFNPVGLIATPFRTTHVGLWGTNVNPTNESIYEIIGVDCFFNSTGGADVNITILDNNDNVIFMNKASLTMHFVPIWYKIIFVFSSVPTVKVYGN